MRSVLSISLLVLAAFLAGCSRDFDESLSVETLSDNDRAWLNDGNGDGEADSLQHYLLEGCSGPVISCLDEAREERNILGGGWSFNEGSGLLLTDNSPYGNDGAISGALWGSGVDDGGLLFDGVNDCAIVSDPSFLEIERQSWTMSAWIKTDVIGTNYMDIISRNECGWTDCSPANSALYALSLYGKRAVFRLRSNNANALNATDSLTNVTDGAWHHIAGILDRRSNRLLLYVDGTLGVSVSAAPLDNIDDVGSPLAIGCMYGKAPAVSKYHFQGAIDEVRVYNRALSASEVHALWALFPN